MMDIYVESPTLLHATITHTSRGPRENVYKLQSDYIGLWGLLTELQRYKGIRVMLLI